MGVMLQAFYWDCPRAENREHQWWSFHQIEIAGYRAAGFTALWLPPANKAANWESMGYDPYDYYDLGEFDQKGGVPTWFGSKPNYSILSDLRMLWNCKRMPISSSSQQRRRRAGTNPIDSKSRWTKFTPKSAKFPRDWKCFHPSQVVADRRTRFLPTASVHN